MYVKFNLSILYLLISFLLIACASGPAENPFANLGITESTTQSPPSFITTPPYVDENTIYGVGKANLPTLEASRKQAISQAQEDINLQARALIKDAIDDYAKATNIAKTPVLIDFLGRVTNDVMRNIQKNSRIEELSVTNDGTIYCLVFMPISMLMNAFETALEGNKEYAFASFRTSHAIEYAQSILSAAPPRAGMALQTQQSP